MPQNCSLLVKLHKLRNNLWTQQSFHCISERNAEVPWETKKNLTIRTNPAFRQKTSILFHMKGWDACIDSVEKSSSIHPLQLYCRSYQPNCTNPEQHRDQHWDQGGPGPLWGWEHWGLVQDSYQKLGNPDQTYVYTDNCSSNWRRPQRHVWAAASNWGHRDATASSRTLNV